MLVVIVDDGTNQPERLDALIHPKVVQDVEACRMNGSGARLLVNDIALVEHGDIDAGAAENETDNETHRSAASDDDPALVCHGR